MDKQKQIEEMAEVMYGVEAFELETLAEALYNAGYRKIPKGAVVLKKEESERLCDLAYFGSGEEEIRKETAEKFAELVKMAFYYHFDELIPSIMADKIDEICKEIVEGKV